ncbi:MAG: diacylglycerol/lipid kinase family protein, partial [Chloroflexota bacterium]
MPRTKLIINPNANLGRAAAAAQALLPALAGPAGELEWTMTTGPGHAVELARQAADQGSELVIAGGGDGTTHEVLNGLMQTPPERRPRLGVVPLGSGNDFAHAVGIDPQPAAALRQALTGDPHRVDVAQLTDSLGRVEYFGNTLGIGFDATVTLRSRQFRALRGFLIYLAAVTQTILLNHEAVSMRVESDREQFSQQMVMLVLCNGGREGGGFRVSPASRPDDGVMEYAAVGKVSRPRMFRLLPEVMRGTHARFKDVRMGQFQRLSIQADQRLYIHVDGEIFAGWGT